MVYECKFRLPPVLDRPGSGLCQKLPQQLYGALALTLEPCEFVG